MRRHVCRLAHLNALIALALPLHAAGPVVLLVGPPGSGRTTQASLLGKDLGLPVIAADDLIRRNPQAFPKNKAASDAGGDPRLDQAMNQLVASVLATSDLSKGLVLDGYPASKGQADYLQTLRQKFNLPHAIIIHLAVPDEVVRGRLKGQKRDVEQELKDYHREFDFLSTYFPQADIRTVDATTKPADVAREVRKLLREAPK